MNKIRRDRPAIQKDNKPSKKLSERLEPQNFRKDWSLGFGEIGVPRFSRLLLLLHLFTRNEQFFETSLFALEPQNVPYNGTNTSVYTRMNRQYTFITICGI